MFRSLRIATVSALVVASLVPAAAAVASTPPPPAPLKPFVAKWILPPRGSSMYATEKAFAESMGYQTVEFDDPTYPGART